MCSTIAEVACANKRHQIPSRILRSCKYIRAGANPISPTCNQHQSRRFPSAHAASAELNIGLDEAAGIVPPRRFVLSVSLARNIKFGACYWCERVSLSARQPERANLRFEPTPKWQSRGVKFSMKGAIAFREDDAAARAQIGKHLEQVLCISLARGGITLCDALC